MRTSRVACANAHVRAEMYPCERLYAVCVRSMRGVSIVSMPCLNVVAVAVPLVCACTSDVPSRAGCAYTRLQVRP